MRRRASATRTTGGKRAGGGSGIAKQRHGGLITPPRPAPLIESTFPSMRSAATPVRLLFLCGRGVAWRGGACGARRLGPYRNRKSVSECPAGCGQAVALPSLRPTPPPWLHRRGTAQPGKTVAVQSARLHGAMGWERTCARNNGQPRNAFLPVCKSMGDTCLLAGGKHIRPSCTRTRRSTISVSSACLRPQRSQRGACVPSAPSCSQQLAWPL